MILRNLLCARRTMHHIRYTIEIWPLFTGDWSHINAYGLPGMPQPELEKILKKKTGQIQKSSENHWKIKQNGLSMSDFAWFSKGFHYFSGFGLFLFQDSLQLRPEPSRQPATGRGLARVGHPASWLVDSSGPPPVTAVCLAPAPSSGR